MTYEERSAILQDVSRLSPAQAKLAIAHADERLSRGEADSSPAVSAINSMVYLGRTGHEHVRLCLALNIGFDVALRAAAESRELIDKIRKEQDWREAMKELQSQAG